MLKIYPEKNEYLELAEEYNLVPVYTELRGDFYTAISIFHKIKKGRYQFLLESAVSGKYLGRYSFMGNSNRAIVCKDNNVSLFEGDRILDGGKYDNPLQFVREYFQKIEPYKNADLPPFVNGVVGYIGYDSIKYFEKIDLDARDELKFQDFELIIADKVIVYDNLTSKMYLIYSPVIDENEDPAKLYDKAVLELEAMADEIKSFKEVEIQPFIADKDNGRIAYKSNFSKKKFESAVETVKKHIFDGDIFQLVLSQRLRVPVQGDAFNLYRALRIVNPSPYMFYLKCNDVEIVGSSPEIHVQLNDGKVTVRPIAGTRPRGKNPEEDRLLEEELLSDEKELAEHLMLVDLGRNDVGRVCQSGTVKLDVFKVVEYYSHVMHIVSNVIGKLSNEFDMCDLIEATFPAGTVSGAPKIRAMEIISGLEPERRGIYSGLVGYFTYDQNFDSCIAIRTMVIKDNMAYLQAGAGIVADSVPEKEYYETLHKIRALTKAIELAGEDV
ncbi:MAG: anthranilate synthase component I [bacterium]|nr:anthranilate synthase component I [bacterium]